MEIVKRKNTWILRIGSSPVILTEKDLQDLHIITGKAIKSISRNKPLSIRWAQPSLKEIRSMRVDEVIKYMCSSRVAKSLRVSSCLAKRQTGNSYGTHYKDGIIYIKRTK